MKKKMNREEYLSELKRCIQALPLEEQEEALRVRLAEKKAAMSEEELDQIGMALFEKKEYAEAV